MKKTLIALAAVAVSSAAMAQVTISGVLDVQAVNSIKTTSLATSATTATTNSTTAAANNGFGTSRVDITASEDLGNGLKATAFFSTGLSAGASPFGDRDRTVGLSGGFGSVRIGSALPGSDGSTAFAVGVNTAVQGDSDGIANTATHTGRRTGIHYTTPNMGGLTANVVWSSGKTANQSALDGEAGGSLTGLSLSYANGPLSLGAGMSNTTTNVEAAAATAGFCGFATSTSAGSIIVAAPNGTCTGVSGPAGATGSVLLSGSPAVAASVIKSKHQYVGASYNLGVAVVGASYKTGKTYSAGVNSLDVSVTTFGVSVPMGAVTLGASMYTGKDAVTAASTADGVDHKGSQISARYALSKRTFAYVAQGRQEIKRQATNTTTAVVKSTQTTAGLSHSF